MQITDHINFSGKNPLIGEPSDGRFVGMTSAYDAELQVAMRTAAEAEAFRSRKGLHVVLGPQLRDAG